MPREEIYTVRSPRAAAINFVTSNGRDRLRVTGWLNASRPSGGQPHYSYTTGTGSTYQTGKTGIRGYVLETGQSFTVRDDYDFANPGPGGKGYHVNAQLGDWMIAFRKAGHSTQNDYFMRVNMTAERVHFDGPQAAAQWYTGGMCA